MEKYIKIIIFSVLIFLVLVSIGMAIFVSFYNPPEKKPPTIPRVFWKQPDKKDDNLSDDVIGIDEIQEGSITKPEEKTEEVVEPKNSVNIDDILTTDVPTENKVEDTTREEILPLDKPVDIHARGVTATRNFVQRDIEGLNIGRLFGKTIRK